MRVRSGEEGQQLCRDDRFGDGIKWTEQMRMNEVISTAVSPVTALAVGLKVDVEALPESVKQGIVDGSIDLNDPVVTVALLGLDAVVGLQGTVEKVSGVDTLTRVGTTCALCHPTVDDSLAPGIGHRRAGWQIGRANV